ncbi:hypothetical protein AI27_01055 [Sphingomonas sp. BHC-A]|nr:hypothetical protein AI27_01055 [Sphingomonas sp. BHC-A]
MKHILVATDFSARSDRASRRAVLTARTIEAELTLVHVVDDDQPNYLIERQRSAATELLGQMTTTLAEVDKVASRMIVTTGDAFDGILRTAAEINPDLIIVGPHRRQFLDTFVGTTAERTIQRSRHPILMANSVPSGSYNRILLATDLTDASRSAVTSADRLGILTGVDIVALHLFDAPAIGMMKRAMEVPDAINHYVSVEEKRARSELMSFLAGCGLQGARLKLSPMQGSVAAAIRACADEQEVDLIVLGTSQRTGIERFLLGSIAQAVLLDAAQDVLVVPPRQPDETSL